MARGVRTGILCYMARLRARWFTPGEIEKALTFRKSGNQKILEKFKVEGLVERWNPPTVGLPPSIASLPPTYPTTGVRKLVSRQNASQQSEKPYRILPDGQRMCDLMKTIEQVGLPKGLQENSLTEDTTFVGKLKAAGFDERDIEKAEKAGILDHRRVKITEERHETTFGDITRDAIANAFQPQVREVQTVIRHRYRIA